MAGARGSVWDAADPRVQGSSQADRDPRSDRGGFRPVWREPILSVLTRLEDETSVVSVSRTGRAGLTAEWSGCPRSGPISEALERADASPSFASHPRVHFDAVLPIGPEVLL